MEEAYPLPSSIQRCIPPVYRELVISSIGNTKPYLRDDRHPRSALLAFRGLEVDRMQDQTKTSFLKLIIWQMEEPNLLGLLVF